MINKPTIWYLEKVWCFDLRKIEFKTEYVAKIIILSDMDNIYDL